VVIAGTLVTPVLVVILEHQATAVIVELVDIVVTLERLATADIQVFLDIVVILDILE